MLKSVNGEDQLVLALPKGSLEKSTLALFEKAGFKITKTSRGLFPMIDDERIRVVLLRPQEIPKYVERGVLDAGVTGYDWVCETNADVACIAELVYAKQSRKPVRWVLAVHRESRVDKVEDLAGGTIATEAVNMTTAYLQKKGVTADVDFSWGATEGKIEMSLADAIVDITETGSSLRANNLRILDTVKESTTMLIANKKVLTSPYAGPREKVDELSMLLKSVLAAEDKVKVSMNVSNDNLSEVLGLLPKGCNPTVSPLFDGNGVDLIVVLPRAVARGFISKAHQKGAHSILRENLSGLIE